jgi:uncharacterized protein with HEPN domain
MPLDPTRDAVHLWDMLKAAQGVISSLQGLTLTEYAEDENLRLATERRIEIIGEAARRVSTSFKEAHPEIPWRRIIDQRNVLVHAYDEIVDDRIWRLTGTEIPLLVEQLGAVVPPLPQE